MTEPVAESTRKAVYDLLYRLEWNFRYFTVKADQLQRWSYWTRFVLLVGVLAEGLSAYPLTQFNWGWIPLVALGLALAVLAIWDALSNHARDSGILKLTALACDELKTEADNLWRDIQNYRIETDAAEWRYGSIVRRWEKTTDKVLLANDRKLNEHCQEEAFDVIKNQYAA